MNRNPDTDRYGDGDIPEADYRPYEDSYPSYEDNNFDPHPQAGGDNKADNLAVAEGNISVEGNAKTADRKKGNTNLRR